MTLRSPEPFFSSPASHEVSGIDNFTHEPEETNETEYGIDRPNHQNRYSTFYRRALFHGRHFRNGGYCPGAVGGDVSFHGVGRLLPAVPTVHVLYEKSLKGIFPKV